jgi:hypothetical protein
MSLLDTAISNLTGLVGWWKLDETSGTTAVNAVNPGTLDGTYTGGYTLGQSPVCPQGGYSVALDGSTGYVPFGLGAVGAALNGASHVSGAVLFNCTGDTGAGQRIVFVCIDGTNAGIAIVVNTNRVGDTTSEAHVRMMDEAIIKGQVQIRGSRVVVSMPADTAPVEYAHAVAAARGRGPA